MDLSFSTQNVAALFCKSLSQEERGRRGKEEERQRERGKKKTTRKKTKTKKKTTRKKTKTKRARKIEKGNKASTRLS